MTRHRPPHVKTPQVIATLVFAVFLCAGHSAAQQSRCGDCHIVSSDGAARGVGSVFLRDFGGAHLAEWERSPHGRKNVGCEKCHGGDATTFEPFRAHLSILNSRNPASPVHRRNLPKTCGACHTGPFVEFQKSKHYELLRSGDDRGPSCSTCHSEVGAYLLSPKGLSGECAQCHAAGKVAPRADYPAQGKLMLEGVREVRAMLEEVRPTIRRIKDKARRAAFEDAYQQAEVPLMQAVHAGHAFVFDNLEERLGVARQRTDALIERLANPAKD